MRVSRQSVFALSCALAVWGLSALPAAAQSVMSDHVRTFVVLPEGVRFPEGGEGSKTGDSRAARYPPGQVQAGCAAR